MHITQGPGGGGSELAPERRGRDWPKTRIHPRGVEALPWSPCHHHTSGWFTVSVAAVPDTPTSQATGGSPAVPGSWNVRLVLLASTTAAAWVAPSPPVSVTALLTHGKGG